MNDTILGYYKMWKARGWRLPIQYFFQNHLFDIIHKTNTHKRLDKNDYITKPESFDDGILYMSCPTNEIKLSLQFIEKKLFDKFKDYQFIDLGSGKGKSILVYLKYLKKKNNYAPVGIEYYKPLVDIANDNSKIMGFKQGEYKFVNDSAEKFDQYLEARDLIVFLYNPFGENILKPVIDRLCKHRDVYIIYIDPEHDKVVRGSGFKLIHCKTGHLPNRHVNIYKLSE